MQMINGLIVSSGFVDNILRAGFAHLGKHSPLRAPEDTIYVLRADVWWCFSLSRNPESITEISDKPGAYAVDFPNAKETASLSCPQAGFVQILTGTCSFNQCAAIKVYLGHDN